MQMTNNKTQLRYVVIAYVFGLIFVVIMRITDSSMRAVPLYCLPGYALGFAALIIYAAGIILEIKNRR